MNFLGSHVQKEGWHLIADLMLARGVSWLRCCCHVARVPWKGAWVDLCLASLLEVNLSEEPQLKRKVFILEFR